MGKETSGNFSHQSVATSGMLTESTNLNLMIYFIKYNEIILLMITPKQTSLTPQTSTMEQFHKLVEIKICLEY